MELNGIDKLVSWFSPERGLKRALWRRRMDMIQRSFEGAARGRRTAGWKTTGTDANAALAPAAALLRQRARDLRRNNPYVERAISGIANNTVGHGIVPAPVARTQRMQQRVTEIWKAWGESLQCDADGLHDFYGIQSLVSEAVAESGEVLIRRRWRRAADGLAVPFQLQVLESDFLDDQKTQTLKNGGQIVQGVEFDAIGRRVAYWLFPEHPGSLASWGSFQSQRVPAEDVIHCFLRKRPGQVRGYTWTAPVMMRLRNFDEMEDALIDQAKIAACFAAFVTSDEGDEKSSKPLIERVEPGIIERLGIGESVTFGSPPTFSGYQPYAWQVLHAVAVGMNVPYELITGDLKGVNFSSGRMGWLEFGRNIDAWRWKMIIPLVCARVWDWFNEAMPLAQNGVMEYVPATWTPPRRDMVDPAAEMDVWAKKVRNGAMPLPEGLRELGYSDPEAVLKQYADTNKLLDELGLVLDTDPRKVAAAGASPVQAQQPAAEEPDAPDDSYAEDTETEEQRIIRLARAAQQVLDGQAGD